MVYPVGLPHERNTGGDEPGIWINPDHIVQLAPLIDGPPDARRLVVELKLIGLPIMRSHLGTFGSTDDLDARWHRLLRDIEHRPPASDSEDSPAENTSSRPASETA